MQMREIDLKQPFETLFFKEYYSNYRNKIEDLFDSERYFIHEFIDGSQNFLDIGCALGGMFEILSNLQRKLDYTGIDISPNLIAEAQRLHLDGKFVVNDGAKLPFLDRAYERVITLGTTVHDQNYKQLISEAWRVTNEKLLFDIRISPHRELCSLKEAYVDDGAGIRYPYVVSNADSLFNWISTLPHLGAIKAYGYWGKANKETTLPRGYEKICMTCLLLEKTTARHNTNQSLSWHLNLPQDILTTQAPSLSHDIV
jgi:hypothetical protein